MASLAGKSCDTFCALLKKKSVTPHDLVNEMRFKANRVVKYNGKKNWYQTDKRSWASR